MQSGKEINSRGFAIRDMGEFNPGPWCEKTLSRLLTHSEPQFPPLSNRNNKVPNFRLLRRLTVGKTNLLLGRQENT
jgi:hypothetical protein